MGIFGRKKVVDLTEDYRPQRSARTKEISKVASSNNSPAQTQEASSGGFFNFFGNSGVSNSSSSQGETSLNNSNAVESLDADEKRRRFAKRLADMTNKIEELSNQVYVLQQKIEVLERKSNINKYE